MSSVMSMFSPFIKGTEAKNWWVTLLHQSALDDADFHRIMLYLLILWNESLPVPIEADPLQVTADSIAEQWGFQVNWGQSILKQHACLSTEERKKLSLPDLPLTASSVRDYVDHHKQLCRYRSWGTSCWMSITSIFVSAPSGLSVEWKALRDADNFDEKRDMDHNPIIVPFLRFLMQLEVIGPNISIPPRLVSFLQPYMDGFSWAKLPLDLQWMMPIFIAKGADQLQRSVVRGAWTHLSEVNDTLQQQAETIENVLGRFNLPNISNSSSHVEVRQVSVTNKSQVIIIKNGVVISNDESD